MSLEIRTALPGDVSAVALLVADLGSPQQVAALPARIAQLADTPTDVVLVVEFDGRVVGVLRACASRCSSTSQGRAAHGSPRWWYIPACRGAGIGGRLLRAAEAAARRRGCTVLELTSAAHREAAHRFYQAAGYEDLPHRFLKHLGTDADPRETHHQ